MACCWGFIRPSITLTTRCNIRQSARRSTHQHKRRRKSHLAAVVAVLTVHCEVEQLPAIETRRCTGEGSQRNLRPKGEGDEPRFVGELYARACVRVCVRGTTTSYKTWTNFHKHPVNSRVVASWNNTHAGDHRTTHGVHTNTHTHTRITGRRQPAPTTNLPRGGTTPGRAPRHASSGLSLEGLRIATHPPNQRYSSVKAIGTQTRDGLQQQQQRSCLLYTSPSPRDRG